MKDFGTVLSLYRYTVQSRGVIPIPRNHLEPLTEYLLMTIEQLCWTIINTPAQTPPPNPDAGLDALTQNPTAAATALQALAATLSPPGNLNGVPDPATTLNSPPTNTGGSAAPAPAST